MGLYKRGKTWWIDYYNGTKRVREKVGPVKDDARIVLSECLKGIRQGVDPELRRIEPRPFVEVVEEFIEKHVKVKIKPRARKRYENRVRLILRAFEGRMLQQLTPAAIEDFIAARRATGTSGKTCNRYRSALSKIFSWAITRKYYGGGNPLVEVEKFQESRGRERFLTAYSV